MPMHMDDALSKRVMKTCDLETKTDAVHFALGELDRQGKILPLQCIVIACCALLDGAAVMTRDKHFQAIPDLRVIEP